ncbi:SA1002 family membrane protein, partial [Staphylococcus aureus]
SILIITFIFDLFNLDYGEFFLFGIIITFTSGVIQLAIIKLLFFKLEVKSDIITVLEHFIQWLLVYFVIYQSFTQNLTVNNKNLNNLGLSTFIDVNNLNLFILPVLLITWITVFMYKIK